MKNGCEEYVKGMQKAFEELYAEQLLPPEERKKREHARHLAHQKALRLSSLLQAQEELEEAQWRHQRALQSIKDAGEELVAKPTKGVTYWPIPVVAEMDSSHPKSINQYNTLDHD